MLEKITLGNAVLTFPFCPLEYQKLDIIEAINKVPLESVIAAEGHVIERPVGLENMVPIQLLYLNLHSNKTF